MVSIHLPIQTKLQPRGNVSPIQTTKGVKAIGWPKENGSNGRDIEKI